MYTYIRIPTCIHIYIYRICIHICIHMHVYMYTYVHLHTCRTPHYTTLPYITLHKIPFHYNTLHTDILTYIHSYIYICMYLYMRIFCVYNICTCLYLFVYGCISLKSFEIQFQSHSKPEIARPDTIASVHQKGKNLSFRAVLKSHFI